MSRVKSYYDPYSPLAKADGWVYRYFPDYTPQQIGRFRRNAAPLAELFVLLLIGLGIYRIGSIVADHLTALTVPIVLTLLSLCARWTYNRVLKVIALGYTVFTTELGLTLGIFIFKGKDAIHSIQTAAGMSLYNASVSWAIGCLLAYLITGYVTYRWIFPRRYSV